MTFRARPHSFFLAPMLGLIVFGSTGLVMGQVNFWWDPAGVSPATGGSGTWDATSFDWLTPSINSPLPTVPWVDGSIANFSGGANSHAGDFTDRGSGQLSNDWLHGRDLFRCDDAERQCRARKTRAA
jgi:hypothetical protein